MYKYFEIIKLSVASIWANKIRSFLTMLGIIIGVFAVVILVASVSGVKGAITKEISALGAKAYVILPGETQSGGQPSPVAVVGLSTLKTGDAQRLKEAADKSKSVTPIAFQAGSVSYKKGKVNPIIVGTWQDLLKLRRLELESGRNFNQKEIDSKAKVALISNQVVKDLFKDKDIVGKEINFFNRKFKVVGTLKKLGTIEIGINFDNMIYIPLSTLQEIFDTKQVARILAEAKPGISVKTAIAQVKDILLEKHEEEDFSIFTQEQILSTFQTATDLLTLLLSGVAAISLLIGGIGIMNIMLVSVVERTSEIGLRKAVGATNLDILIQFLTEAVVLSTLGSFIGLLLADLVSIAIKIKTPVEPIITPFIIYLAIGFGISVGVIFGVAPAIRAARLDPIIALHHE